MSESLYTSAVSAVVRALTDEVMQSESALAHIATIKAGVPESRPPAGIYRKDALDYDSWMHARLRSHLSHLHWTVLVARYSTNKAARIATPGVLASHIKTPAPHLFTLKATTAWVFPRLKGQQQVKRSTDVIVLPDAFYDMNGWDTQAKPERTRRRWRASVFKALDALLTEALAEVEALLLDEEAIYIDPVS